MRSTPLAAILSLSLFLVGSAGCVQRVQVARTCGLILLVDGQQRIPTLSQFQAVERSLGPEFKRRGLSLVPEVTGADLLATVETVVDSNDPAKTHLVVRDLATNTFRPPAATSRPTTPSIRESDREHAEAMRGFTRPGDS